MKHLFVVNPHAFKDRQYLLDKVLKEIDVFFKITESEEYVVHISQFPRDAIGFIRAFMKDIRKETIIRVYAVGGDGILFDCLNGIMGFENAELAAIPYGSTNNFVQGFGKENIPRFRDISRQFESSPVPIDVMKLDGAYALNFCTLGIESEAIFLSLKIMRLLEKGGSFSRLIKKHFYEQLYYLGGLAALFGKKYLHQCYRVDIDGEDCGGYYRTIHIANSPWYGGNKCPIRIASPNDGVLDVLLGYPRGALHTLIELPDFVKGRLEKRPDELALKQARKISVSSETPMAINYDDIVYFDQTLTVELLPGAVQFVNAGEQILEARGHAKIHT